MRKKDMIKDIGREIVTSSRDCAQLSKEIEKVRRMIEKFQEKRDKSRTQKTVQKNQELVEEAQQDLARLERALSEAVILRDAVLTRKKELEELSDDPFQAIQSVSREKPMPVTVVIKMMTGDILSVDVDFQDSLLHFPLQFAQQHQYNLSVVKSKMLFLVDEEKDLLNNISGNPLETTWSEEFKNEDDIPMIHLFIRPEEEKELSYKISLIQKILENKHRKSSLSQEDLINKYSEWNLHYMSPPNSNRYLNSVAFIEENNEYFPPMDDDEKIDLEYEKKRRYFIRLRDENICVTQSRRRGLTSNYISHIKNMILNKIRLNSNFVFSQRDIILYRSYLMYQELIDLGVTSEMMFSNLSPNFVEEWKEFFPSS